MQNHLGNSFLLLADGFNAGGIRWKLVPVAD
jgi:hypothetical protein